MNSKRKVQFDETKRVKKFNKSSDESDSEQGTQEIEKNKHTLDSDEEDNTDKYKLLNQDCLKGYLLFIYRLFNKF